MSEEHYVKYLVGFDLEKKGSLYIVSKTTRQYEASMGYFAGSIFVTCICTFFVYKFRVEIIVLIYIVLKTSKYYEASRVFLVSACSRHATEPANFFVFNNFFEVLMQLLKIHYFGKRPLKCRQGSINDQQLYAYILFMSFMLYYD